MKTQTGSVTSEHPDRRARSRRGPVVVLLAVFALLAPVGVAGSAPAAPSQPDGPRPTIVLVHGDFADGSSWSAVIERLQDRGFTVVAAPNPLRGPSSDAPYLASLLRKIRGPIVLVGHSYGGFVITNAARGNRNIKALVYINALIPDRGQTVAQLAPGSCVDPAKALNSVPVPGGTDLYLRREANPPYPGFARCFANGVDRQQTDVLAAVQRPASAAQFIQRSGTPAWKTIPSWSLIGTADRVIPPAQQRAMSTRAGARIATVDAGHLSPIVRPGAVARIIEAAARETS